MPDLLIANATVATMLGGPVPYGLVPGAAIVIRDGRIAGVGPIDVVAPLAPGAEVEYLGAEAIGHQRESLFGPAVGPAWLAWAWVA